MINFNVGVLGHVDSGKTSLVKTLSTTASTAAFDKNPQSKERGITLDLGFSSFITTLPDHMKNISLENGIDQNERMQVTLVDCPGHASLIRTIIGGSQIVDMILLVIDIVKGVQTQTAECLVVGEILCDKMIVVLNKIDLIPEGTRAAAIDKMTKRISKTLEKTRFSGCPIVSVAANPGSLEEVDPSKSLGIQDLIDSIRSSTYLPKRHIDKPLLFSVDHCFSIKGQGTVLTGTILQGQVNVNDTIEIPHLKVSKKVKSMQMFRKPVNAAVQGDRVGVCVTQFDPSTFERGYVCSPGSLSHIYAAVTSISRISYYKLPISSKQKFHITIGHETIMASLKLFGSGLPEKKDFSISSEYLYKEELGSPGTPDFSVYALLEFERPIFCLSDALFIASKLDLDVNTSTCRIAFHGMLIYTFTDENYAKADLPKLKVYKIKERKGVAERLVDDYTLIGRNLFKKETNIQAFVGLNVSLSTGERGVIEGSFGQSGKFKVRLSNPILSETKSLLMALNAKQQKSAEIENRNVEILLTFKRYMYDHDKQMKQST